RCARELHLRRGFANAVAEGKTYSLLDAKGSRRQSEILQTLGEQSIRILILVPDTDVGAIALKSVCDLFTRAALFEGGTYIKRFSLGRQDHREHSFASPPTDAREVIERSPFHQEDRIQLVRGHQLP